MVLCYLALGSNLNQPKRQLKRAIKSLTREPRVTVIESSSVYLSKPQGVVSQPKYYNMVILINTKLTPFNLLKCCQKIENNQLRVRKKRWGARTIDIDILLFGDTKINKPNLCIPHPEMFKRDFVLVPLLEIMKRYNKKSIAINMERYVHEYFTCNRFITKSF